MCGIFGFVGKPDKETVKIFRYLGFLNETRGKDSTGFCAYTKDDIIMVKDIEPSTRFFSKFENIKTLSDFSKNPFLILMGHTRQATIGAVTKKNAHPFRIGKIILTHNGNINNFEKLNKELKTKHEVDSQIIGQLLATEEEKEAFKKLEGWFTVAYIDIEQENMLNIATSNGTLSYAIKQDKLYYSSSDTHLSDALRGQEGFKFFEGSGETLYRIYPVGKHVMVSEEKLEEIKDLPLFLGEVCSVISKNIKAL